MTILKTIWLSTVDGQVGIVHTQNSIGEKEIRISATLGGDEKLDRKYIAEHGAKLHPQDAIAIVEHLTD